MTDEQAQGAGGEQEAQGEPQEPDYKALYEQAKANSRKWERQAKANKDVAAELERAQKAGKSAEERIAELTQRLDEKERAEARARLASEVAQRKGVPAELLVGDDAESMEAWADKLLAHFKQKPAAKAERPGKFDRGEDGGSELREFARQLLGND